MPSSPFAALSGMATMGQPHTNLKLLSPEELEIFNRLLPLKHQLFSSKKSSLSLGTAQPATDAKASQEMSKVTAGIPRLTHEMLAAIANQVSEMMELHNKLRGVSNDGELLDPSSDTLNTAQESEQSAQHTTSASGPRNALDALFDAIHVLILELYAAIDLVSPTLLPIFTQLMSIQNSLEDLRVSMCFTMEHVVVFQRRLRTIENTYVKDGRFVISGATTPGVASMDNPLGGEIQDKTSDKSPGGPTRAESASTDVLDSFGAQKGQAILFAKLNYCYRFASSLVLLIDTLDDDLVPIHERLVAIQRELVLLFLPKGHALVRDGTSTTNETPTGSTLSLLGDSQPQVPVVSLIESFPLPSTLLSQEKSGDHNETNNSETTNAIPSINLLGNSTNNPVVTTLHLTNLQHRLHEIDNLRSNGQFLRPETGKPMQGQALVVAILEHCYELIEDLLNKKDRVSDLLYPLYEHLVSMKQRLQELLENRWDVRPQDIYPFERAIKNIEATQIKGVFYGPDLDDGIKLLSDMSLDEPKKRPIPNGQATIHYLLHTCHRHIYKLHSTIEPVDPALQGIHHHMIAVRKCLVELKRIGGPFTPQELYPFQLKLKSFDDLRRDGKIVIDGEVPPGQGVLHSLLSECYGILDELKSEIEYD